MEFINNGKYELRVIDIRKDSAGYDYIALENPDINSNREIRVYNILACQINELPQSLYVKVSIDEFGKIKFKQDIEQVFRDHYKEGKIYGFTVISIGQDHNTQRPFYEIEDEITSHRYYFQGEQTRNIGDSCILEIDGFTDKGFIKFKEVDHVFTEYEIEKVIPTSQEEIIVDETSSFAHLEESDTVEFKSSIVFVAKDNSVNIDKQLYKIITVLTSFMNKNGGTLYIGIHDRSKTVVGIEKDLEFINSSDKDEYSYNPTFDHYELKIRNTIDSLCPSLANDLIKFKFVEENGKTYCQIDVETARRPIYISGSRLYVRQGNRNKLLTGEEMTLFIVERMASTINRDSVAIDTDAIVSIIKGVLNERTAIPEDIKLPPRRNLEKITDWYIWYNNRTWMRSREKSNEANVHLQVPLYTSISNPVIVFCYDNGRINTVKLSDFRKKTRLNVRYDCAWCEESGAPKNIFIATPTDYIIGKSIDANGFVYAKLHSVSDFVTTAKATNLGNPFLPSEYNIIDYAIAGAEHNVNLAHLIIPKRDRTRTAGLPVNTINPDDKKEIEYLEALLKQLDEI